MFTWLIKVKLIRGQMFENVENASAISLEVWLRDMSRSSKVKVQKTLEMHCQSRWKCAYVTRQAQAYSRSNFKQLCKSIANQSESVHTWHVKVIRCWSRSSKVECRETSEIMVLGLLLCIAYRMAVGVYKVVAGRGQGQDSKRDRSDFFWIFKSLPCSRCLSSSVG